MKRIMAVLLIMGTLVSLFACNKKINIYEEPVTVGDGTALTIGVLGRVSLADEEESGASYTRLKQALTVMRNQGVQVVLCAGGLFAEGAGTTQNAQRFVGVYNSVFQFNDAPPYFLASAAKSDVGSFSTGNIALFEEKLGVKCNAAALINNCTFITVTQVEQGYAEQAERLRAAIAAAPQNKPIFVLSADSPRAIAHTDSHGVAALDNALSGDGRVVSISSSSNSLLDGRSLFQSGYTALSGSYMGAVRLADEGFVSAIEDNANPLVSIVRVDGNGAVTAQAYSVLTALKANEELSFRIPLSAENIAYGTGGAQPRFEMVEGITTEELDGAKYLRFMRPLSDGALVYGYKVSFDDLETLTGNTTDFYYFAGGYSGTSAYVLLKLAATAPKTACNVTISPISENLAVSDSSVSTWLFSSDLMASGTDSIDYDKHFEDTIKGSFNLDDVFDFDYDSFFED